MRKSLLFLFTVLFSVGVFAQTAANSPAYTIYNGQDYMPRLFEPYQADYLFTVKGLGMSYPFFDFSTKIIERQDSWSEEMVFKVSKSFRDKLEGFPEAVYITSEIDLKTGLLRKITGEGTVEGEKIRSVMEISDDQITFLGWSNGKLKDSKTMPLTEKIYPCSYSEVFYSYLPLKDDFAGEFNCVNFDNDDGKLEFVKMKVRVVGSERVTINAGSFDCFKIITDGETRVTVKGKKKDDNYRDKYGVLNYFASLHSYTWIDKETRIPVKSELDFKKFGAKLEIELQKRRRPNV